MKTKYFLWSILMLSLVSFALLQQRGTAQTINPHAGLTWNGPGTCLTCHDQEAREVHASGHSQWGGQVPEAVNGPALQGKFYGAVNSYCINILGNWNGCGACHIGLGVQPTPESSTTQLQNIDCLMCHQKDYKRIKQNGVFVPDPAMTISLDQAVQTVHRPDRINCLQCHAKGGGGDNFKRGDIALAHSATTDINFDRHMATTGANLKCQDCHTTDQHRIAGRGSDLRQSDLEVTMNCSTSACHGEKSGPTGHTDPAINRHVTKVACQSCHIPLYAKNAADTAATEATEMHRDWSKPKATAPPIHPTPTLLNNQVPKYRFWNRLSYNYYLGEAAWVDPETGNFPTSRPIGGINDPGSKLYPFKYKTAYQPLATNQNRLIALDTSVYFATGNLDAAVKSGLKNMYYGQSDPYQMVTTDTYQLLNHEVPPKASALTCTQCHGTTAAQMNLPAMGYTLKGQPATVCNQCHDSKNSPGFEQLHNKHVTQENKDCLSCHNFTRASTFIKAKTQLATEVTGRSARINGLVNPGGKATIVSFQWGTGTLYGNNTLTVNIGSGPTEVPVSAVITGLVPGSTYHFRVVAQDGNTLTGYDYSFTTARLFSVNLPVIFQTVWNQLKSFAGRA